MNKTDEAFLLKIFAELLSEYTPQSLKRRQILFFQRHPIEACEIIDGLLLECDSIIIQVEKKLRAKLELHKNE